MTRALRARAEQSVEYREERDRGAPYERIVREILLLRMKYGLSQQALAERVGTSHSQIARIEGGQYRPTVETLRRIADVFGGELSIRLVERTTEAEVYEPARRTAHARQHRTAVSNLLCAPLPVYALGILREVPY